jgi:hypothetical protein
MTISKSLLKIVDQPENCVANKFQNAIDRSVGYLVKIWSVLDGKKSKIDLLVCTDTL